MKKKKILIEVWSGVGRHSEILLITKSYKRKLRKR